MKRSKENNWGSGSRTRFWRVIGLNVFRENGGKENAGNRK